MKQKRKFLSIILVLVMALSTITVNAGNHENNDDNGEFYDVGRDHWAYEYIKLMSNYKIINGYGNGKFGPSDAVSREQFAKMMVLTMQLDLTKPSTPYFEDVNIGDWSYKYVETAKSYLTGYKTGDKYYFRPTANAEREDMAVAIVRGLKLSVEGVDLSVLDQFKDEDTISTNLRPYVAKAVEEGIMIGDDKGNFGARNTLQRAEAATLLYRLIEGEKVVFDEEKIVIDEVEEEPIDYEMTPVLEVHQYDEKVKLEWSEVWNNGFSYYKVVVSKYDSTPSYPSNGRTQAIGNVTSTRAYLEPWQQVWDGDVSKLQPGETYYVAITAVYGSDYYTSNVVQVTIPEAEEEVVPELDDLKPTLTGFIDDGGIKLDWTDTPATGFVYYKVVMSKTDSTPIYPGDGYLAYISDRQDSDYFVNTTKQYNGGDINGYLEEGEIYHISITAVYKINGEKYYAPSNTLTFVMP